MTAWVAARPMDHRLVPLRAIDPLLDMMVLPDLIADDLDVVFRGTAAGTASAVKGAYYAGPGNVFWPTLYAIGLTRLRSAGR